MGRAIIIFLGKIRNLYKRLGNGKFVISFGNESFDKTLTRVVCSAKFHINIVFSCQVIRPME